MRKEKELAYDQVNERLSVAMKEEQELKSALALLENSKLETEKLLEELFERQKALETEKSDVIVRISPIAFEITSISAVASRENTIFFVASSSETFKKLIAWSLKRSKSPIVWRSLEILILSALEREWDDNCTR